MKACWSRPIQGVDGKVLATFGFYFDEERAPNAEEMSRMDGINTHRDHVDRTTRMLEALRERRGALSAYGRGSIPRFPWIGQSPRAHPVGVDEVEHRDRA